MKKQIKTEADSLLRVPKSKPKLGLKIKPIAMPHVDLIKPESQPALELVEKKSLPSQSSHTSQGSHTSQSSHTSQTQEIAPTRDFSKVANSIARLAVPDGWFKGKSKQLYDALYLLTRGAISPARVIRIQKTKLMKLSCIGARNTFDRNIEHLSAVGLLKETIFAGEHEGNEFEVFLPEEITMTSLTSMTSQTSSSPKLDRLVILETSQTRQTQTIENINDSEALRLSLKTNTIDDDALTEFANVMNIISRKLTDKDLNKNEKEKWKDLAELLAMEMEIAAARTGPISSIPAFLTEHLRRRLMRKITAPKSKVEKPSPSKSEESELVVYEAEPLSRQGREVVLGTFKEYVEKGQRDFVLSFKETYTEDDWQFLMENIK